MKIWLIRWTQLAAAIALAGVAIHLGAIVGGESWYVFFGAPPAVLASARAGTLFAPLSAAAIALAMGLCAAYAFSALGRIRRLPLLRVGLAVMAGICLLRALILIPLAVSHPELRNTFEVLAALVWGLAGSGFAAGFMLARHLAGSMSAYTVLATSVPELSFLASYAAKGAYTDCFALTVAEEVGLPALVEAFYTTRLFKLERWVLAHGLKLPSTDLQAKRLAVGEANRFAAWVVEQRGAREVLLDAGQTRSWLSVTPAPAGGGGTKLLFGSAVVPMRSNGRFGWWFHALGGLHRFYSRQLLAAAARRVLAVARLRSAA